MWKIPAKISNRSFRTYELAVERVLKKYPDAKFIPHSEGYVMIYVGSRFKGLMFRAR